jgi:signal transduction histidine kinase
MTSGALEVTVHDSGAGATSPAIEASNGSGLRRLRERLGAIYSGRAELRVEPGATGGFTAVLAVPQDRRSAA